MENLKIDRSKLYTQSEYAKKLGLTRARINQKIKAGEISTVKINGAVLVYE
jgi:hypothetical protein